jgi:Putative metallopeptidase
MRNGASHPAGRSVGHRGVALLLGLVVAATGFTACGSDESGRGRVTLTVAGGSPDDERLLRPAFEAAVRTVNREIHLPSGLAVRVVDDRQAGRLGISGPTYEPRDRAVYFPWSFVDQSRRQLPDDAELRDAMVFALYHELTHGLIDMLDVPIVGGEERAADSLAAVFAIRSQGGGQQIPLGMAKLLETRSASRRSRSGGYAADDYADDHELDPQRAADALCLVYGSNPRRYAGLVGQDLPRSRADTCPFAYREELDAWRRLLARWLTHQGGLLPEKRPGDQ